jgi:hypothetical protein
MIVIDHLMFLNDQSMIAIGGMTIIIDHLMMTFYQLLILNDQLVIVIDQLIIMRINRRF